MQQLYAPERFGTDLRMWTGIVKDRNDPFQKGRVRVQIFGLYSDDIPVDGLPWAIIMNAVTSAGIAGVGASPVGLMEGTIVTGTFVDGSDMQIPMVIGSLTPGEWAGPDGMYDAGGMNDNQPYNGPSTANFVGDGPRWFQAARGEIGVKEFKGGKHNPRVLEYAKTNGFHDDETPWCSSFVKWCVQQSGYSTEGANGLARSWSRAGCVEKLDAPLHGCIVVTTRPPSPTSGHVGFLDSMQGGVAKLLGGNQSNRVCISGTKRPILGMFWPVGAPKEGFEIR